MKKKIVVLGLLVCFLLSLSACKYKNTEKYSDEVLERRKAAYEKYLAETYPDQKFTVRVWQEYGKKTGAAGLPDYEGYLLYHVIIDSEGNIFQICEYGKDKYGDNYQEVKEGRVHYSERGRELFYREDGTWYEANH